MYLKKLVIDKTEMPLTSVYLEDIFHPSVTSIRSELEFMIVWFKTRG